MRYSGRVAFGRFWYARGPMLMIGMAYGVTLLLATLTFTNLGNSQEIAPPDRITSSSLPTAQLLTPAVRAKAAPRLPAMLADAPRPAICP